MTPNLILDTDSYKASHYLQYPPGTESMFSYFESRGGQYPETVFFGLQYLLKKYLTTRVTEHDVVDAGRFFRDHGLPFNAAGWMHIANQLDGKLPIKIRAVPEGMVVPTHNVLMTVESTDPDVFWIVSWLETMLVRLWYPITVATRSRAVKQTIMEYLNLTSDDPEGEIGFKLHDFGSRGVSSQESAEIGGMSHLVNFLGSDTVVGVRAANRYYNYHMAGFSIPASEHSTITAWGEDHELDAFRNMLEQFAEPGKLLAVVSDSYDIRHAVSSYWGKHLRKEVKESGAMVVIRPDSGDPTQTVLDVLQRLKADFGFTVNSNGYCVLNNVRVIQGDGMDETSIEEVLQTMTHHRFSTTNVAFGMGGGLLQQVNRDTNKFAFKCSNVIVNGQHRDVFKSPAGDEGKRSKAGRLDLVKTKDGELETRRIGWGREGFVDSVMQTVYENGEILVEHTLDEVRERAK